MKKPVILLLIVSLLANAMLAIAIVRPGIFSSAPRSSSHSSTTATTTQHSTTQAGDASIIAAINNGDTQALLASLKAAGLDEKNARFIAAGLQLKKFADQANEIMPPTPYWRRPDLSPAARAKMQQLAMGLYKTMREDLSEVIPQIGGNQYAYLSPERRTQLRQMEKDYDDLNSETIANTGGFRLQSDNDTLKALSTERKREIDQFLTPDEVAARDMRQSDTAKLIRADYGNAIDNEAEYQSIYSIMKSATDEAAGRSQVEALLGADRMAKLAQTNDPDYNLIQAAATRLNLPVDATAASLTQIRNQAQQASLAISNDSTLTDAQRKTSLQQLATTSQTQMSGILGADGAQAYAKSSRWVNTLQRGSAFTVDSLGKLKTKK